MSDDHISVEELKDYWKYIDNVQPGEIRTRGVLTSEMPPWHEICAELDRHLYKVSQGHFTKKHHGFCGVYRLIGLEVDGHRLKPASISRVCGEDVTGTLYIGEARWRDTRLNQLRQIVAWVHAAHQQPKHAGECAHPG